MKFLIILVVFIELIVIYKILNISFEKFKPKKNKKEIMKKRQALFDKENKKKNKEWERQAKLNRGRNSIKKDYKNNSKIGNDNSNIESDNKPNQKEYKYKVFGFIKLDGDITQIKKNDEKKIKTDLCNKLNKLNKTCKIKLKPKFIVEYIIDMNEVDILKIKKELKIGETINGFKIIQSSPPSITNKAYKVRKNPKNTLNPNYKNKRRDIPKFYDWTPPLSKPFICSPPQDYDNSPIIEYELTNGTPISFLDETNVGYILPKFKYQEY